MDDLLVLCATGPAGAALWTRAAAIHAAAHAARLAARSVVVPGPESLFAGEPGPAEIATRLRPLLPTRSFAALRLAIAVDPAQPNEATRLVRLLEACSGITQLPAPVHLAFLAPERLALSPAEAAGLQACFDTPAGRRIDCRDFLWVRAPSDTTSAPPSDLTVAAATRPLWYSNAAARQPLAVLQGLVHYHRDSLAGRLVFDRAAWERFAQAAVIHALTHSAAAPPSRDISATTAWPAEVRLPSVDAIATRVAAAVPAVPRTDGVPAPGASVAFAPLLREWLAQLNQARDLRRRSATDDLAARIAPDLDACAARIVAQEGDILHGLHAVHGWARSLRVMLAGNDPTRPPPAVRLQPAWIDLANSTARLLPDAPAAPFDRAAPSRWAGQLATLLPRLAHHLIPPAGGPPEPANCAAALLGRVLPGLVQQGGPDPRLGEKVAALFLDALGEIDAGLARLADEHAAAQSDLADRNPAPVAAVARLLHPLLGGRRLRRRQRACTAGYAAQVSALTASAERILSLAATWLELAARQSLAVALAEEEQAAFERWFAPIGELHASLVASHATAQRTLERGPAATASDDESVPLLEPAQCRELTRDLDPQPAGWLQAAAGSGDWRESARRALATLDAWATARVAALPVNLAWLLEQRFPGIAGDRIAALADRARARLLPLRAEGARVRRLQMEWLWPAGPPPGPIAGGLFEQAAIASDSHSLAPAAIAVSSGTSPDELQLHLHLLGFGPADYLHWRLLPGAAADPAS